MTMLRPILILVSCAFALPLAAREVSREQMMELLNENHHRAAAGHNPYEAPEYSDTRAPRGFRPVYVSHYSRHGSRYQGGSHSFESVLPLLDSLSSMGLLTATGDSLRHELHLMYEAHDDNHALLTRKGAGEQQAVAARLFERVPSVFRQKKARAVHAASTSKERCLQSVAAFATSLKGLSPKLDITYTTGLAKNLHYLAPRVSPEDREYVNSIYVPLQDSLLSTAGSVSSFSARLFTDVEKAGALAGGRSLRRFVYEIFEAAQGAGCLDIKVDPLRFFTNEELYEFLQIRNLYFCANYGPLAPTRERRQKAALPLLRGIMKEADAALAGNGRCADFRFGHDGGLGPLLMLVGVEGFDKGIDPRKCLSQWPAWKYIPMCSNLQMIFYRNRRDEVLVKFLRNENETKIPALEAVNGVYYRWHDVRRYFLTRTGDYKQLPEYYREYLDVKAERIRNVQRREADGFFFWTDSHFSDNAGNAAAVLEYIQGKTAPRRLFHGGDVARNAEHISGGLAANTSSMLQAGLYGNLFPVRGNHDFTSTTSHAVTAPETMGNLEVNRYLKSFLSPSAVTDNEACGANYYYVDSPKGKIRYLVLDSTDSVSDMRVRYGMSRTQMQWVFCDAVASLPAGWKIMVLSHVPLAPDHSSHPTLVEAGSRLASNGNVLMCICGHRHADMESGIGTVFQVLTAADCLDDMGKSVAPYAIQPKKKTAGTTDEQTLDYVSISRDHSKVTFLRIGWGYDRIFNVRPVEVKHGESVVLKPSLPGPVKWFAYDTTGNSVGAYKEDGLRDYVTAHEHAHIMPDGTLQCHNSGDTIAVALYEDGTKEFYMIKTIN